MCIRDRHKLDILEGFAPEMQQTQRSASSDPAKRTKKRATFQKTKMCPNVLNKKPCPAGPNCMFAHTAIELDLVSKARKIEILEEIMKKTQAKNRAGQPPKPWRPTSTKEAFIDMNSYDEALRLTKKKNEDDDNFGMDESGRTRHNIFERDIEDIDRLPFDRAGRDFSI
eukprot:TRINITY_DN12404_c0_g1_i2.p1 TRINITY_DN12404_c0_g1~~TRINITY_DN12404_c0_g1_i2.p1  ORF type:complete len:169 (-),score=48.71 TRINITY_DN12404_c0_g1_i2:87-593(-)